MCITMSFILFCLVEAVHLYVTGSFLIGETHLPFRAGSIFWMWFCHKSHPYHLHLFLKVLHYLLAQPMCPAKYISSGLKGNNPSSERIGTTENENTREVCLIELIFSGLIRDIVFDLVILLGPAYSYYKPEKNMRKVFFFYFTIH